MVCKCILLKYQAGYHVALSQVSELDMVLSNTCIFNFIFKFFQHMYIQFYFQVFPCIGRILEESNPYTHM
ncbi:hypothetical protein ERO13_D08G093750v2 [Gossypium hirsutum]|nr:hypothetical protein ERO13_D08G093750v2 [Gossypium hirsutum]